MGALLSATIFIMNSRSMLTKTQIVLAQVENHQERVWKSIQFAIFKSSKFAVELNRVLSEFILLCHVHIQESSREENAKFKFLRIIRESKRSPRVHFLGCQRNWNPEIQIQYTGFIINLMSNSEAGTHEILFIQTSGK